MISINGVVIVPTIFPDKTSQVWKLPDDLLNTIYKDNGAEILWGFESEAELIHLAQLKTLLDTYTPNVTLNMPYCPFARQDKRVDNGSTFALATFAVLLNALKFQQVKVLDIHCESRARAINSLVNTPPNEFIERAWRETGANQFLFPDAGAATRYAEETYVGNQWVSAEKIRDQATGEITGTKIHGDVRNRRILIVDDICDGGRTFIEVAKVAHEMGAMEVHLYTTHGLYSKGIQVLRDAGIDRIYNRKGGVK